MLIHLIYSLLCLSYTSGILKAISPINTTYCGIWKRCLLAGSEHCTNVTNCTAVLTYRYENQTGYTSFEVQRRIIHSSSDVYVGLGCSGQEEWKSVVTACAMVNGSFYFLPQFNMKHPVNEQTNQDLPRNQHNPLEIGTAQGLLICRFKKKLQILDGVDSPATHGNRCQPFLVAGAGDEDAVISYKKHSSETTPKKTHSSVSAPSKHTTSPRSTTSPGPTLCPCFSIITTENCSVNKSCFRFPKGCNNSSDCRMIVTYTPNTNMSRIHIELGRSLDNTSSRQYVAMGLSSDANMYPASVTSCIYHPGSEKIGTVLPSHNIDTPTNEFMANGSYPTDLYANIEIGVIDRKLICRFDQLVHPSSNFSNLAQLNQLYYLLLTVGLAHNDDHLQQHSLDPSSVDYPHISKNPVNLSQPVASSPTVGCAVKTISCSMAPKFYKAHGILMLIGFWILLANGIIFARYFKHCWPNHEPFGIKIWFHFHRGLNSLGLLCILVAVVLMLIAQDGKFPKGTPHPYVGWAAIILATVQPIMAIFRCHPNDHYRPIFNHCHRFVGASAWILATANIFLARKGYGMFTNGSHGPSSSQSTVIMIIYVVVIIVTLVLLELQALMLDPAKSAKSSDTPREYRKSLRGSLTRNKDTVRAITIVLFAIFAICTVGSLAYYITHSNPII